MMTERERKEESDEQTGEQETHLMTNVQDIELRVHERSSDLEPISDEVISFVIKVHISIICTSNQI